MSLIRKENGTICSTSVENIGKTIVFEGETYFVARNGYESIQISLRNIVKNLNVENNQCIIRDDLVLPINNIVVTHVTNMTTLFSGFTQFNHPLDKWDVSNVSRMGGMFKNCENFNQPLNNWDVSNVIYMCNMFDGCENFNQPLNNWNVTNVTRMGSMFDGCKKFNQLLNNWDVYNVRCMSRMFNGCETFNQSLENWNVSNVGGIGGMSCMFKDCVNFNQPLNYWDITNVSNVSQMFYNCVNFNQPLRDWDEAPNITLMNDMFHGCNIIQENTPNITSYQVSYLKYKDLTQNEKEEHKTCPITTEDYDDDTDIAKTSCGHVFNKKAFTIWMRSNNTCPMCRRRCIL